MTPKLAFRFIFAALVFGLVVVTTGMGISRLQQQAATAPVDITKLTEEQLRAGLMQLDANGNGIQVFNGTSVNVRILPYPPAAGKEMEIRVVALSPEHAVLRGLHPELFLGKVGVTDGPTLPFTENADGSYSIRQTLPQAGTYRGQIRIPAQNDVFLVLFELIQNAR